MDEGSWQVPGAAARPPPAAPGGGRAADGDREADDHHDVNEYAFDQGTNAATAAAADKRTKVYQGPIERLPKVRRCKRYANTSTAAIM